MEVTGKLMLFKAMALGEGAGRKERRTEARAWSTARGLLLEQAPDRLRKSYQAHKRKLGRV